ncbi:MAG: transaldolase [Planctomycetota bacterium]|nr:transaldolase [Planctomycetota bacterium]MEC8818624.1 transaldolase [Planctomycetota bacterium]MEC9234151.1 transaldolase [Planctomycetota bacterium]MED6308157.1 transaldolase [Planctomycetota bacterium]
MPATADLHALGQSLWIDNITRGFLDDGTIAGYINDMSVTGLTSNPSIFQKAIAGGHEYDDAIRAHMQAGLKGEELFFELAIEDLRRACDLFAPIHEATNGLDGWCSLEVSPLLANDTHSTIEQAKKLHAKADRKNLYIKVPGTPEGAPAIEELTFAGIPVNVTLIFSVEHYMRAAEAYTHGLERRVDAGLDVSGCSVASLFISRWDVKTSPMLPDELKDTNGLAIGGACYKAYVEWHETDRWKALEQKGALRQRLLFASTGTKDPALSDSLYVSGLAAPDTVNTMPDKTLKAFHDHGTLDGPLPADGTPSLEALAKIEAAGVDLHQVGEDLQVEGAQKFDDSWKALLADIESKTTAMS